MHEVALLDDLYLPEETRLALQSVIRTVRDYLGGSGPPPEQGLSQGAPRVLFVGPRGTGKTHSAQAIADALELEVRIFDVRGTPGVTTAVPADVAEAIATLDAERHLALLRWSSEDAETPPGPGVDRSAPGCSLVSLLAESRVALILSVRTALEKGTTSLPIHGSVAFAVPERPAREAIWRRAFPEDVWFDQGADLPSMLSRLELTGRNIVSVVDRVVHETKARGSCAVRLEDVLLAIETEVESEGRVFLHLISGTARAPR